MAELDLTNIAAASISTPASGVTAVYVESTSPAKRLSTKNDAGTVINLVGLTTADQGTLRLQNKDLDDATTAIVDDADTTKKIAFSAGGNTTSITLTLAAQQVTAQTLSFPIIRQAETIAAKPQVAGTLVAAPSAISNTGGLMLGLSNLSSSNIITPQVTGRVCITIQGVIAQNTSGDGAFWHIRTGTGTAPSNGGALTGTQSNGQQSMTYLTGVLKIPFSITTIVTGATLGTALWIDLVLGTVTGGTATATQVTVTAFEL